MSSSEDDGLLPDADAGWVDPDADAGWEDADADAGWGKDAPLPDESPPSYDGYKMYSSEEEGDWKVYPDDDLTTEEDMLSDITSPASFETDKFPHVLTLPPPLMHCLGDTIVSLNREVFAVCEDARRLVTQLYRADLVLKTSSYSAMAWELKHGVYDELMGLKNRLQPLLKKICQLGGPYYRPPYNLWKYINFFWYDSDSSNAESKSVTPEPSCDAPDFHKMFCGHTRDIGLIMEALKVDKISVAPELREENIVALVEDLNSLSLKAQEYQKSHLEDVFHGSSTEKSDGLYVELLHMEEVTRKKILSLPSHQQVYCRFPYLLENALDHLKEEKEEEKKEK